MPIYDESGNLYTGTYSNINEAAKVYDSQFARNEIETPVGQYYPETTSKYDMSASASEYDIAEHRAQEQSVGNRVLKTPFRVASTAIAEVAKMPGYLGGLADWASTGFDSSEINRMVDNAWVKGVTEAQDYVNEDILSVYTPESVRNGGLLANLGSASFWATEGADGVGFLVSFLAPGVALKAIGMGAKGAELLNFVSKGSKLGTEAADLVKGGAKFGAKAARNIDDIGSIMANTTLESAAEATDTYKTAFQSYKDAGYTEEQSKQMAGKAAAGDFTTNLALLAATNTVSQIQLFGAFSKFKNEKGILGRMFDEEGNFVKGLKKTTLKERLPSVGKELAKGILSEGFLEEGVQTAAQKYWQEKQLHPEDHDNAVLGILKSYRDNFSDIEMQKSIFLGSFLGSIQGGISHYRKMSEEDKQMFGTDAVKPNKLLKGLGVKEREATTGMYTAVENGLINDLDVKGADSIYKKDGEGKYIIVDGERQVDTYKLGELVQKVQNQDNVANMMQLAKLMGRDDLFNRLYLATKTPAFLQFIKEDGGLELLNKHIDSMTKSDVAKMGETFNLDENQVKSLLKGHAESLNRNYQAVNNTHDINFKVAKDKEDMQSWYNFSNKVFNRKLDSAIAIDQAVNNLRDLNSKKASIEAKDEKGITEIDTLTLKNIEEQIKYSEEVITEAKQRIKDSLDNNKLSQEYNDLKNAKNKIEAEVTNVDTTPFDVDSFLESKGYGREDIRAGNITDIFFNYKSLDGEKELVAKLHPDGKFLVYDKSDLSAPLLDTTGLPIEFNKQYIESNLEKIILLSESEAEGLDDDQLADSQTLIEEPAPSDIVTFFKDNFDSARRLNVKTTGGNNLQFDFVKGVYRDIVDSEGFPIPNADVNQQRWYKHLDDNNSPTYLQDKLVMFVSYKDLDKANIPEELKSLIRTTAQNVTPDKQATAIFSVLTDNKGVPVKDKNDKFLFTTIGTTESLFEGERPLILLEKVIQQRLGENVSDDNAGAFVELFDPMVPSDASIIWDNVKYTKQELYNKLVEQKKQEIIDNHRAWRKAILTSTTDNSIVYSKPESLSNGIMVSQIDVNSPSKTTIKNKVTDIGITIPKVFKNRGWSILIGDQLGKTVANNGYKVPSGWAVIQQGNNVIPISSPTLNKGQVDTVVALLKHLVSGTGGLNKFIETTNGKIPLVPNIGLDNRPNKNTNALLPNLIHYGKVDKSKMTKGEVFFDKESRKFKYLPENATEYSELSIEDLNNPVSPNLLIFKDFLSRKRLNINKSLINGEEIENPNLYLLPQINEQGNLVMVDGKLQMIELPSYEHYLLNYITTPAISKNNSKGLPQFASRYLVLNDEVKTTLEETKKEESPIIKEFVENIIEEIEVDPVWIVIREQIMSDKYLTFSEKHKAQKLAKQLFELGKSLQEIADRLNKDFPLDIKIGSSTQSPIVKEPTNDMFIPQEVGNELQQEAEQTILISDIEAKKADIERRRQEELKDYNTINFKELKNPEFKYRIKENNGVVLHKSEIRYSNYNNQLEFVNTKDIGKWLSKWYPTEDYKNPNISDSDIIFRVDFSQFKEQLKNFYSGDGIKFLEEFEKLINAKYNAELAALEPKPIDVKEEVKSIIKASTEPRFSNVEERRQEELNGNFNKKQLGFFKDGWSYAVAARQDYFNFDGDYAQQKYNEFKEINAKYDALLGKTESTPIQRTSLKDRIPIGTTPYSEYLQAFRESGLKTIELSEVEWNSKKQHEMDKIISCLPKK